MELIAHLSKQPGDNIGEGEETEPSSSKGKKEKGEKEVMQVVRELNMTDFEALSEEEDAWLVAFYAGNDHAVTQRGGVTNYSHCTCFNLLSESQQSHELWLISFPKTSTKSCLETGMSK